MDQREMDVLLEDAALQGWAALPDIAVDAIQAAGPTPRLVAHLVLVHDAAAMIIRKLQRLWPEVDLDWQSIAVGAAIHDIGKAFAPGELVGPGKTHEQLGESFLLEFGLANHIARHARTHGLEVDNESLEIEDLLVILADKLWRGGRRDDLEERVSRGLTTIVLIDYWDVHPRLLDVWDEISDSASRRLAWQSRYRAV